MTDTDQPTTGAALADELDRISTDLWSGARVTQSDIDTLAEASAALRSPAQVEGDNTLWEMQADPRAKWLAEKGPVTRPTAAPDDEAVRLLQEAKNHLGHWLGEPIEIDVGESLPVFRRIDAYLTRKGSA